jgi:hypothetical protein
MVTTPAKEDTQHLLLRRGNGNGAATASAAGHTVTATTMNNNKIMGGLLAERLAPGSGILCNDANGLCLGHQGTIDASQSGIYTTLAKLASLLDGNMDGTSNNMGGNDGMKGNKGEENHVVSAPIVSIQTDKATILLKEYGGGRTVAFRVPNVMEVAAQNGNSDVGECQKVEFTDDGEKNEGDRDVGSGEADAKCKQ